MHEPIRAPPGVFLAIVLPIDAEQRVAVWGAALTDSRPIRLCRVRLS